MNTPALWTAWIAFDAGGARREHRQVERPTDDIGEEEKQRPVTDLHRCSTACYLICRMTSTHLSCIINAMAAKTLK